MHSPTKILAYNAGGAIEPHRILKFGASDLLLVQAVAAADALVAVSERVGAASGERISASFGGPTLVEYGDAVTRGDLLTADADGKAIKAEGDPEDEISYIGRALVSGVAGDIGSVNVAPGMFIIPAAV